jgi:hypothetical protein
MTFSPLFMAEKVQIRFDSRLSFTTARIISFTTARIIINKLMTFHDRAHHNKQINDFYPADPD